MFLTEPLVQLFYCFQLFFTATMDHRRDEGKVAKEESKGRPRSNASKIAQAKRRKMKIKENKAMKKAIAQDHLFQSQESSKIRRENIVLKNALARSRHGQGGAGNARLPLSCLAKTPIKSAQYGKMEAKKKITEYFPSNPADLVIHSIRRLSDSRYSGTFGSISVGMFLEGKTYVAMKTISMKKSSELDILAEVRVTHALSGHYLFPYCYGFIRPNILVMSLYGNYENKTLEVFTLEKIVQMREHVINPRSERCIDKNKDNEVYFVKIAQQLVEGISYMHQLKILHNDIKMNNVIMHGQHHEFLKIIDFGKSTLVSHPVKYNLSKEQQCFYNQHYKYLAPELRNSISKQTEMTDTYSVGYIFTKISEKCPVSVLKALSQQLTVDEPSQRQKLSYAQTMIRIFLTDKK